jgi:hypothetical protein
MISRPPSPSASESSEYWEDIYEQNQETPLVNQTTYVPNQREDTTAELLNDATDEQSAPFSRHQDAFLNLFANILLQQWKLIHGLKFVLYLIVRTLHTHFNTLLPFGSLCSSCFSVCMLCSCFVQCQFPL